MSQSKGKQVIKSSIGRAAPCHRTDMLSSHAVMALITLWIGFLEWGSVRLLSNFAARKLCHAGCGVAFLLL